MFYAILYISPTLSIKSSGATEAEAVYNVLHAGYCGEIDPDKVQRFCDEHIDTIAVQEVNND